jgi:hypothetical protein
MFYAIRLLFSSRLFYNSICSPQLLQQQQRLRFVELLAFKQPHTDPRPPSDTANNYVANKRDVHKFKANRAKDINCIQALSDQRQYFNKFGNARDTDGPNKGDDQEVEANLQNFNDHLLALTEKLQHFNKYGADHLPRKASRDQKLKPGNSITTGLR